MNLTDQRPLERALADIVEKYDRMPGNRPERFELARMIQSLEAEILRRNTRDQCSQVAESAHLEHPSIPPVSSV